MQEPRSNEGGTVGPVDGLAVPRYAGHTTFARLAAAGGRHPLRRRRRRRPLRRAGSPTGRARGSGPSAIRQGSRLLRPYNPALDVSPFARDAGRRRRRRRGQPVRHLPEPGRRSQARAARARPTRPAAWSCSAATTPSRCRCCARSAPSTGPSPWSTSTPTSTPGTPTSARPTPTARRSAGRGRRACCSRTRACTSASAGRSTPPATCPTTPGWASPSCPRARWTTSGRRGVVERIRRAGRRRPGLPLDRHRRARPGASPPAPARPSRAG